MAGEITQILNTITQYSNENKNLTNGIKEATNNEVVALEKMSDSFDEMLGLLSDTESGNKEIAYDRSKGKDSYVSRILIQYL